MKKLLIPVFVMLCICNVDGKVLRFDFGGGAQRPNWVSVKSDDSRLSGGKVFGEHCKIPDYNALAKAKKIPAICPTSLDCDFIAGTEPTKFSVSVPDGKYHCYCLFGYANTKYNPNRPYYFDTTIKVNGVLEDTVRIRCAGVIFHRTFDCKAKNGRLEFEFSTNGVQWIISAIMIYADKDAPQAETEIRQINNEMMFLPKPLAKLWKLRKRLIKEKLASLTPEEEGKGYVVYHRGYLNEIYPDSKPSRAEIQAAEKLSTFTTPGEFEPITFSIYSLKKMKLVSASVSIPGVSAKISYEVCVPYKEGGYNSSPTGYYRIAPSYLQPINNQPVILREAASVRFWIVTHAKPSVKPGIKRGYATLQFADGTRRTLPLELEVLPFRLENPPDITYSVYYDTPLWFFLAGSQYANYPQRAKLSKLVERYTRSLLADMHAHGMNALSVPVTWNVQNGKPQAACESISRRLFAMYREYHLDKLSLYWRFKKPEILKAIHAEILKEQWRHMPKNLRNPKFYAFMKGIVKSIEAERKRNGWPEIVYVPVDEPFGTKEQLTFAKLANSAIKTLGVRTYCTMKVWLTKELSPMVDLRCYGVGFYEGGLPYKDKCNIPEKTGRKDNTRPGQEFWVYPNELTCAGCATAAEGRFIYGVYGFKIGLQGYNPWHYANWRGNPYNEMTHWYNGGRFILPGPDGPIPTIAYEGVREGIDDMRYVYTLERAIGQTQNKQAAKESAALLVELRHKVPCYADWIMRYAHTGRCGSKMIDLPAERKRWKLNQHPDWSNDMMWKYRRRIADAIIKCEYHN